MSFKIMLTGDINLMNVADPAVPFRRVASEFRSSEVVFSNLECCLYAPPQGHTVENEGFFAAPGAGGHALKLAGTQAVGIATNVDYGGAALQSSTARLDELCLPDTGGG